MTSINLLGFILIAVSFGLITYECQKNKWGYVAVVFAAIGGKMFL